MIIIGVDFHPEFQQIAFLDSESGEFQEKRLLHREENRDLRQLLWHRHRLVQARTRIMNKLQSVAINERTAL